MVTGLNALLRAYVQSLIRKLRSHKLCIEAKKKLKQWYIQSCTRCLQRAGVLLSDVPCAFTLRKCVSMMPEIILSESVLAPVLLLLRASFGSVPTVFIAPTQQ